MSDRTWYKLTDWNRSTGGFFVVDHSPGQPATCELSWVDSCGREKSVTTEAETDEVAVQLALSRVGHGIIFGS